MKGWDEQCKRVQDADAGRQAQQKSCGITDDALQQRDRKTGQKIAQAVKALYTNALNSVTISR